MSLLIDGYNLLHATDIFGGGTGPGGFQRSREALLSFLATSLNESERQKTTIVFDASEAPPGLPNEYSVQSIRVIYARDYPDADSLIEELIEDHQSPRGLLVVSSDHRVQRASRRRGSKHVDSDRWYADLWRRRIELRRRQQKSIPEKPVGKLNAAEIAYWVEQFDGDNLSELTALDETADRDTSSSFENPFPPGYADDLLDDQDLID